jgi:anti-sigma factor ChrR (cupin superfamily)
MLINADFLHPVLVLPEDRHWVPSPQAGVERVMLDRVGAEKARATSLVRYAPDSEFPPHAHPGGEEILVLDGVFSDETGDYPAGCYLRNPPGSSHRPASEGALIFVKLRQMSPDDQAVVRIDTTDAASWQRDDCGVERCPLHRHAIEQVDLLRLPAGHPVVDAPVSDGAEILVLEGSVTVEHRRCPVGSWLRLPAGIPAGCAGPAGALIDRKVGLLGRFCDGL